MKFVIISNSDILVDDKYGSMLIFWRGLVLVLVEVGE